MELLAAGLRERGYVVLVTREPGGTPLGEAIRDLLLDPRHHGMSARAEALLYAAARAHLVEQVIRPALEDGQVVLCDRYLDSSLAYQGYGRGLGTDDIITLNVWATDCLFPDLTLFLDLDDSIRSTRLAAVPDRLEAEDEEFHRRVAEGFRELLRAPSPPHPPGGRHGHRGRGAGAGARCDRGGTRAVQPLGGGWRAPPRRHRAGPVRRHRRPGDGRSLFAISWHPGVSLRAGRLARLPVLGSARGGQERGRSRVRGGTGLSRGWLRRLHHLPPGAGGAPPRRGDRGARGQLHPQGRDHRDQPPRRLPAVRSPGQGLHLPGGRQLQR